MSEFIATPDNWPHPYLRPRSEEEAAVLLRLKPERVVFVFGSNLAGNHAGGAAAHALHHFGAQMGRFAGLHGLSFAIPTLDGNYHQMGLAAIKRYVDLFLSVAEINNVVEPFTFYVTPIGTGIAGFSHDQIAPLFAGAPSNCLLPPEWAAFVSSTPDRKDS